MSETEGAPPPDDLQGWAKIVATTGALGRLRREDVIKAARSAAVQSDTRLFNGIMAFLSEVFLHDAGRQISRGWKNGGMECAERVHHHLMTSVLDPNSADGKQMEKKYWPVLRTRTIDAVREERSKQAAISDSIPLEDAEEVLTGTDALELAEHRAEVERIIRTEPDERKRLAIRLHLMGVPYKAGKGTTSIDRILGVSDKTAALWVAEMLVLIKSKVGESK